MKKNSRTREYESQDQTFHVRNGVAQPLSTWALECLSTHKGSDPRSVDAFGSGVRPGQTLMRYVWLLI